MAITNAGPSEATNVVLSTQLPANVAFVSATGGAVPNNGVLLLNIGTLPAHGATNSIKITVQPTLGFPLQALGQPIGQLTNVFNVSSDQTDPNLANNSAVVSTTLIGSYPGTPVSWFNPGGSTLYSSSLVLIGGASPIQATAEGNVVTNCQPGDIVLLANTNNYTNPTNWLAIARFLNPDDPTGTNSLPATYSQLFFSNNFNSNGFRLFPDVAFVSVSFAFTNNGFPTFQATYAEFGPADAITGGQEDINTMIVTALVMSITQITNKTTVSWTPSVYGWTLQTNNNLATGVWGNYEVTSSGNNSANMPRSGNLFFRLMNH